MEKEKLSIELKGLVGETSMSEKSWNDYLDNVVIPFAPEGEDKFPEYLKKHSSYLKSQSGQYNKDIADKVKTEVERKFEELKKNFKPDTTQPDQQPYSPSNDPILEKLKELDDFKKKLEDERNAEKADAFREKTLSDIKAKLKEEGATNETILELILPLVKIESDSKIEDLLRVTKDTYDEKFKKLYGDGVSPAYGRGSAAAPIVSAEKRKEVISVNTEARKKMNV